MKHLEVGSLLIFLLFQSISSSTEPVEIKSNYEIVEIPPESSDYIYFLKTFSSSSLDTSPYIFLKFLGDVEMKTDFDYDFSEVKYSDYFRYFPVKKFFNDREELNLQFNNRGNKSVQMIFIDTTLEINVSFDEFLNWKHELKYIQIPSYYEPFFPEPIIFNVEKIEKTAFYIFDTTTEGRVAEFNDTELNLLYYCINSENDCEFKELNTLTVYQGNKYKFKLNSCYLRYEGYFFPPIIYADMESDELLETIDLTKNKYYNFELEGVDEKLPPKFYKVENLAEDKIVLFNYDSPYSHHEDDSYSPFKICNINNDECSEFGFLYKFLKNNEYIIIINYMERDYYYGHLNLNDQKKVEQSEEEEEDAEYEKEGQDKKEEQDKDDAEENNNKEQRSGNYNTKFIFPKYMIMPINENVIETKTQGYYTFSEFKILVVNLENKDKLYAMSFLSLKIIYSYTDKIVTKDNLDTLSFKEGSEFFMEISNPENNKYFVFISMNIIGDYEFKIAFTDKFLYADTSKYTIEAKKNALIYLNDDLESYENNDDTEFMDYEEEEDFDDRDKYEFISFYNTLKVYSSNIRNMKLIGITAGTENIDNNLILENTLNFPIYVGMSNQNTYINVQKYGPRYAFFGAVNNYLFQNYIDYFRLYLELRSNFNLNQVLPFALRGNSDVFPFNEYFNFYVSEKLKTKIKIYVRKIYGSSEFYECSADPLGNFDISIITKPLSSCKNKKSLLNKLITFEEGKILSGYLDLNSYFDIYIDIEEENKDINPNILINEFPKGNTAKYLTKGVEYNIKLEGQYLVKLEPGFNAEISIYDGTNKNILKLNAGNPKGTVNFEGSSIKIKSNNNAMVYFYSKLPSGVKQVKIDNKIGKNIMLKIEPYTHYYLDFGYDGYLPSNLVDFRIDDYIYEENQKYNYPIENLYDKLVTKLPDDEFLYIYYEDSNFDVEIDYSFNNLNNPKNQYTFMVIPKTDGKKDNLIINNFEKNRIRYQVKYCKNPGNTIKMHYYAMNYSDYYYERFELSEFDFSNEKTILDAKIPEYNTDLKFESSDEFIFSYSFIDDTDKEIYEKEDWINEREELKELTISGITDLKSSSKYSIKFKPNYKKSSTRYIVVIAEKNNDNTLESMKNPCHLVKLATEKPDGVKTINIYDIGENEYINAELDLSDFLDKESECVVSIISQELRFEKKINFYNSISFGYKPSKNEKLATVYIVLLSIGGLIVLLIILFIIIKSVKRKQDDNFAKKAQEINQEKLLSDM